MQTLILSSTIIILTTTTADVKIYVAIEAVLFFVCVVLGEAQLLTQIYAQIGPERLTEALSSSMVRMLCGVLCCI